MVTSRYGQVGCFSYHW